MRVQPGLTDEQALRWLEERSAELWGEHRSPGHAPALRRLASTLARVAAAELPDDQEPAP